MEFIIKNNALIKILEPEEDVHIPEGVIKLGADVFNNNDVTLNIYFPESLIDCSEGRSLIFRNQESIFVNKNNPVFSSYDGVLYNKEQTIIICCPMGKGGVFKAAPTTKEIAHFAFCCSELEEVVLNEGLESIHSCAFCDHSIKKPILMPRSLTHISHEAFEGEWSGGNIIVFPETYAYYYAKRTKNIEFTCVPYDNIPLWNSSEWKQTFLLAKENAETDTLHSLRQKVFMSTIDIVKAGKYQLPHGDVISLDFEKHICTQTKFYSKEIPLEQYPKLFKTQIIAVNDDCLSFARKVCKIENDVCVLNMASRRNPGGGVLNGAGAQEEYLFRCSDYYRSLYQFADFAGQYGIDRSEKSYPMDRNFGGIFSPNVTVFRDSEEEGYRLLHKPWQVNMIAVAGINHPALTVSNGEERIAIELIDSIKNKIRTIFRIAATNSQKTLILGALGCGAFMNPPKHTAEIFKEVLDEPEFTNVFRRVFFVIKEDHNSRGTGNFQPFADAFGSMKNNELLKAERLLLIEQNDTSYIDTNIFEDMLNNRCSPESITHLNNNEVFVFGTSPKGEHNSTAAKFAVKNFGAIMGKEEGLFGQSYAIPVHKYRTELMHEAIKRFIDFARRNQNMKFFVLPIGCGKAGMEAITVAAMFNEAIHIDNIFLPKILIFALRNCIIRGLTNFDKKRGKLLHQKSFGNGLLWSLYGDGTLEISGHGPMPNYTNHWDSYFGEGQPDWIGCEVFGVMPFRLIIDNGITYVGDNAFESFGCLKEVWLADTITKLGKMAFFDCFHIERINVPPYMNFNDFERAELPLFYNKSYVRINNWLVDKELTKTE